ALSLCACCRHYPGAATGIPLRSLAAQSYQPSPVWQPGRPAHGPFRGLLGVHSRYGLHTRAVTVFRDTLTRRLQPFRFLHSCSGCFRLERLPGGAFTHWKSAALSRRTPRADVRDSPEWTIPLPSITWMMQFRELVSVRGCGQQLRMENFRFIIGRVQAFNSKFLGSDGLRSPDR